MLAWFDVVVYLPAKDALLNDVSKANPEDQSPPEIVKTFLSAAGELSNYNVSRMIHAKAVEGIPRKQFYWHAEGIVFSLLTYVHISKNDAVAIVSTQSYNGEDRGLSNLAKRMFQKSLSQLTVDETAQVTAVPKAPWLYLKHEDALFKRKKELLKLFEEGT